MDLSKLPRLSKTDAPADAPPAVGTSAAPPPDPAPAVITAYCGHCGAPLRPGARFCDSCGAQLAALNYAAAPASAGTGAEVWISLALGALLLFIYPRFLQWLFHPGRTDFDATDTATGNSIPYAHSAFMWQDAGTTLFAVAMIFEGLILAFARRRPFIVVSLAITCLAVAVNLFAIVYTTSLIGFPIVSALAVVFGVYIAIYEWKLLHAPRT